MKKNRAADYAVYFIIGGIYAVSIAYVVMRATIVPFTNQRLFFWSFLFLVLSAVVFYNVYTLLASALILFLTYFPEREKIFLYVSDLYWFIRGYGLYEERFVTGVLIFVCLASAVFTCVFLLKFNNFYFLTGFGAAVLFFQFAGGFLRNTTAYVFMYACILAFAAIKLSRARRGSSGALSIFFILPVCLLISSGAYYVSGKITGYDSETAGVPQAIDDFVYFLFNRKYYDFESTGYGSNERLGGKVSQSDKFVMNVYSDSPPYLAGAVKTIYTGDSWTNGFTKTDDKFDDDVFSAGFRNAFTAERILNAANEGIFLFARGEIKITGSRLATLFWPGRSTDLTIDGRQNREIFTNPAGELIVVPPMTAGDSYSFTAIFVDYNDEDLREYLRTLNKSAKNFLPEEYYQLPDSLPRRVYDLAAELTAPYDNNFDKIAAIDGYLTAIPYTLSPPPLPDGRDFVDYFLFDEPRGYCTYFASALAVAARAIGIPSRYVEGFIMPPNKSNGSYYVTNMQAHAWAEIYFEGFGWVPFEATPAYSNRFHGRPAGSLGNIFAPDFFDEPEYENYLRQYGMENEGFRPAQPPRQGIPRHTEVEKSWMTLPLFILLFPGPPAFITALYFTLYGLGKLRRKAKDKKLSRLPANERANEYFRAIIKMASYFNYPVRGGETAAAYGQRLGKRFAFKNESVFMRDLVKIYYKCKYGGGLSSATEKEAEMMGDCCREFVAYIDNVRSGPISRLRQGIMGYRQPRLRFFDNYRLPL